MPRGKSSKNAAGHLPSVDIVAGRTYYKSPGYTTINTDSWNNTVGVQVSIPLFSGGSTQGRVNQASAIRERAEAELDTANRSDTALGASGVPERGQWCCPDQGVGAGSKSPTNWHFILPKRAWRPG